MYSNRPRADLLQELETLTQRYENDFFAHTKQTIINIKKDDLNFCQKILIQIILPLINKYCEPPFIHNWGNFLNNVSFYSVEEIELAIYAILIFAPVPYKFKPLLLKEIKSKTSNYRYRVKQKKKDKIAFQTYIDEKSRDALSEISNHYNKNIHDTIEMLVRAEIKRIKF